MNNRKVITKRSFINEAFSAERKPSRMELDWVKRLHKEFGEEEITNDLMRSMVYYTAGYLNVPMSEALWLVLIYRENYREDGDYENITRFKWPKRPEEITDLDEFLELFSSDVNSEWIGRKQDWLMFYFIDGSYCEYNSRYNQLQQSSNENYLSGIFIKKVNALPDITSYIKSVITRFDEGGQGFTG